MNYCYSRYNIVLKENNEYVYLYNSYTGALCKLEKNTHEYISHNDFFNESCDHFDELLRQGFIIPHGLDEYNRIVLTEQINKLSLNKKSISYVIAPTLSCNLNCVYCFEDGVRENGIISEQTIIDIADYILKSLDFDTSSVFVNWFGGEPLIAYKRIEEFSKYIIPKLNDKGISYSSTMVTNGVLLTKDRAKVLKSECNINKVQITVDGTKDDYCVRKKASVKQFEQLMLNIKDILQFMQVSIRLNSDGDNFEDLKVITKEIYDNCNHSENLSFYIAKLVDYTHCGGECFFSQDDFDKRRIEFEKYVCEIQKKEYLPHILKSKRIFCGLYKLKNQVIGPHGEIYKCEHHVGNSEKIVGNIKCGLFYNDFLMKFMDSSHFEQCKNCKIFPICLGGCPADKYEMLPGETCFYSEYLVRNMLSRFVAKD